MAVAGCGTNSCAIIDRSGAPVAQARLLAEIEWARLLDDTSTARVVILPEGDCCDQLGLVRTWRHRLVVFRDGTFVWEGPITRVQWKRGQVEIHAADVTAWLDRRVPHQNLAFSNVDLTTIAEALIDDAFRPDDPGHEVQVIGPARVRGSRSYTKDIGQTGDHLRDLAEAGLDYTVVGSKILLLPETHLESVGRLTDGDFPDGLAVAEDGGALATRWVLAGSEENDVVGSAGGTDEYYGLLERYDEQTSITDSLSAANGAQARLRASLPSPLFIDTQQVTISPQAAVAVAQLVPGWCLDITTTETCRRVSQRLKIVGLTVSEDGGSDSEPGIERVQVQVAATGAETT